MILRIALTLVLAAGAWVLYFFGLSQTGLLGPDEPRYADIGRAMWTTGDWITPRLFGSAWFEKPALLYWLGGLGFATGADDSLAPRLFIPILGLAFLAFFYTRLRHEFDAQMAGASTLILATAAGWVGFSHAAVTDLPLTVFFGAGMLLSLPWALRGERNLLPWAAACFAVASLAKGLVPLVLAAPLLWFGRKHILDWLHPKTVAAFVAVGGPWYVLCYLANGQTFIDEFFWKHHVGRFFSEELQHVQPVWFYAPVLLGLLLPWAPLGIVAAANALRKDGGLRGDSRWHYFAAWLGFGFVFFSASTNKLPGYLLPLLPAAAALLGLALRRAPRCAWTLAIVTALSGIFALAGGILPEALAQGLRRSSMDTIPLSMAVPSLIAAALVYWAERSGQRTRALTFVGLVIVANIGVLKWHAIPQVRENASAIAQWKRLEPSREAICIDRVHRALEYGLLYYSHGTIALCADEPRSFRLVEGPDRTARLEAEAGEDLP